MSDAPGMPNTTRSTPKGQSIESLYLLKALCAFLVVVIHCNMWGKSALQPIMGIATPCFLCITGYFLYSGEKAAEQQKAIRWAKKAFMLSLAINAVYLLQQLKDGASVAEYTTAEQLPILITGTAFSLHLWYLSAMWMGLLLFYLLRRSAPAIIIYTPLLYLWSHICYKWGTVIFPDCTEQQLFIMRCNGLIVGLPFLCTGYLLAKYRQRFAAAWQVPLCFTLSLFFLFNSAAICCFLHLQTYGWLHFCSLYIFICSLMLLCVRYRNMRIPMLNTIGRCHSANIYFFHILVLIYLKRSDYDASGMQAIIVFLCCIPISFLINTLHAASRYTCGKLRTHSPE